MTRKSQRKGAFVISSDRSKSDSDFEEINEKTDKVKLRFLTPSSDQLASLDLKAGQNLITFTV